MKRGYRGIFDDVYSTLAHVGPLVQLIFLVVFGPLCVYSGYSGSKKKLSVGAPGGGGGGWRGVWDLDSYVTGKQ